MNLHTLHVRKIGDSAWNYGFFVDDTELKGLTSATLELGVGQIPQITFTMQLHEVLVDAENVHAILRTIIGDPATDERAVEALQNWVATLAQAVTDAHTPEAPQAPEDRPESTNGAG